MGERLYVEHDGQIFLVKVGGVLTLPTPSEVPFAIRRRKEMRIGEEVVWYSTPESLPFPHHWISKDSIPEMENIDPLVRKVVHASYVREVAAAVLVRPQDPGEVLMVKASRGFTRGTWNVPGGFIQFGETPEEGVVREVGEETGLAVRVEELLAVCTERFQSPWFLRGHVFLVRPEGSLALRIDPDEIEEACWMPIDRAFEETRNPFARKGFEIYRSRLGGSLREAQKSGKG